MREERVRKSTISANDLWAVRFHTIIYLFLRDLVLSFLHFYFRLIWRMSYFMISIISLLWVKDGCVRTSTS